MLTAAQRAAFIRVPWALHAGTAAWVPPLIADQRRALDPRRGEYFRAGNSGALWLARREGRAVGRIAALRNEAHLRAHADGAGFFGFFECVDDAAVARELLATAEAWLHATGLRSARGPANFNIQEEAGVLLDAFDLQPMVGMTWTPPHYRTLLEQAGYARCRDLRVYRMVEMDVQPERTARLERVARQIAERGGVTVRPLDLRQLARESRHLALVFEESWHDNWGHVPVSAAEFLELYQRYKTLLVPELIYLAEVGGEPAGAWVTMPDFNVPIKASGGRLWPLGWWRMLRARTRLTRFRVMMTGVRPQFRRLGLPMIFAAKCREELRRRGATDLEFSWILDDNREVIESLERMGARRVQTLRLYEKALA
ncbi:MAG: hypothetical protein RLZZ15_3507 [Verrucomicrobiota bacterium]